MPDQFGGDVAPGSTITTQSEENPGILEQVKLSVASVAKSFTIDMWLASKGRLPVFKMLS